MSAAPGTGFLAVPQGFATDAIGLTLRQIGEKYGCDERIASRWRKEVGLPPVRHRYPNIPLAELQRLTDSMPQEQAADVVGVSITTFRKMQRAAGVVMPKTRTIADRVAVTEARREMQAEQVPAWNADAEAARAYLQRLDAIWRCGPDGAFDHTGTHFRFRGRIYDADGVVAVARAKGWEPDGWARVAA